MSSLRAFFRQHFTKNKKTTASLGSLIGVSLIVYFAYHAIQGPRGLIVYHHLKNQVATAESLLVGLEGEKKILDDKVNLLQPQSVSPDVLDEQARAVLNFSHPNDVIILMPPVSAAPSP